MGVAILTSMQLCEFPDGSCTGASDKHVLTRCEGGAGAPFRPQLDWNGAPAIRLGWKERSSDWWEYKFVFVFVVQCRMRFDCLRMIGEVVWRYQKFADEWC